MANLCQWLTLMLALTKFSWTLVQGNMEQHSCIKLDPLPYSFQITTRYAPSLITCSFLCRDTPNCRTYTYSGEQCSLYRTNALWTPSPTGLLTCTNARKVCPKTMNNGEYTCFLMMEQNTCYCMSSVSMGRKKAGDSCTQYGMHLISVESSEENAFIRNILRTNTVNRTCVWTSALRTGPLAYNWNTTGQAVNIDMNRSSWLLGTRDCLLYNQNTPTESWLWDDDYCSIACVNMCEFTP